MGGEGEKPGAKGAPEKKVETKVEARRKRLKGDKVLREFKEALNLVPEEKDRMYKAIAVNLKKNPKALTLPTEDKDFGDKGVLANEARDVARANSPIWEKLKDEEPSEVVKGLLHSEDVTEKAELAAITFVKEVEVQVKKAKFDKTKHKYFTVDYNTTSKMIEVKGLTEEDAVKAEEEAKKTGDDKAPAKPLASYEQEAAVEAMKANPFYGFVLSFFGLVKIKDGATEAEEAAAYEKAYHGLISGKSKNPLNFFARLFLPVPGAKEAKDKLLDNAKKVGKDDFVSGVVSKMDGFLEPYKSYLELDTKPYMPIVLTELGLDKIGNAFPKKAVLSDDVVLATNETLKIKVPKGKSIDLKTSTLGSFTLVEASDPEKKKINPLINNAKRDIDLVLMGAIGADSRFGKGVTLERETVSSKV